MSKLPLHPLWDKVIFTLAEAPNEHNYSTVQVLFEGTFNGGKRYGIFDITRKLMETLKRNFERFNAGGAVMVDYNHLSEYKDSSPKQARAAGWIQKLMLTDQGLFAVVKWTKEAAEMIRDEQYKFISAAFAEDYTHPNSDKPIGAWLSSIALTNRPFMKGIQPVALTEEALRIFNEDTDMKVIEIEIKGTKYRIAEDQADAFKALMAEQETEVKTLTDERDAAVTAQGDVTVLLNAAKAENTKLLTEAAKGGKDDGATEAAMTLLRETVTRQGEQIVALTKDTTDSKAEKLLSDAVQARKLTKAEGDIDGPWGKVAKTDPKLFSEMLKTKPEVVPAKPQGKDDASHADKGEVGKRFNDMVAKRDKDLREADTALSERDSYKRAMLEIVDENPSLASAINGLDDED